MDIQDQLRKQIKETPVLLYMKGTKEAPQCGFSATALDVLFRCEVEFESVDVLANSDVRSQLPLVSNWPTFPQLYINGELIGGSDIILAQYESGDLQKLLAKN